MGYGLENPQEQAWPNRLGSALSAAHGHPVTVVTRFLYIEAVDPAPYIRKCLDEVQPDIILFSVSAPGFGLATVANALGRVAGKRARSFLIQAEVELQNLLGSLGSPDRRLTSSLKKGVRKAAGARTRVSVGEAMQSGTGCLRAIAAYESTGTVVRVPLDAASWVFNEQADQMEMYHVFRDEMRRRTLDARMTWADSLVSCTPEEERAIYLPDGVHMTPEGHKRLVSAWLPATLHECERSHETSRAGGALASAVR